MVNVANLLKITNSHRGVGFNFEYKGKKYKPKDYDELANAILSLPMITYEKWWPNLQEDLTNLNDGKAPADASETVKLLKSKLRSELDAKREYRDAFQQNAQSGGVNATWDDYKLKPENNFNAMDAEFLEPFYLCEENEMIYSKVGESYRLIGGLEAINKPFSAESRIAAQEYIEYWKYKTGSQAEFCLWASFYETLRQVTEWFFDIRRDLEEAAQNSTPPEEVLINQEININGVSYKPPQVNAMKFLRLPENKWDEHWVDELHSSICKLIINKLLPTVLFREGFAVLQHEKKRENFNRYYLRPAGGRQCGVQEIIAKLLSDPQLYHKIKKLNFTPRIISDDIRPATYHIDNEWQKKLPTNSFETLEECKILNTFLSKYTDDEKLCIMAWAYAALHPSTNELIGLLIRTGGGAFKNECYFSTLKYLLGLMYDTNPEVLAFLIKGLAFKAGDKALEPGNKGISKAALVCVDEALSSNLELYKHWSGTSQEKGVDYSYSKVYKEGVSLKIYAPFLFLTNRELQIENDNGVYERRLISILRPDIYSLPKPYSKKDYAEMMKREAKYFYKLAEKCYNQLIKKYGDFDSFNIKSKLVDNLDTVYDEPGKIAAYSNLYDEIESLPISKDRIWMKKEFRKEAKIIRTSDATKLIQNLSTEFGLNPGGLKNWIFTSGNKSLVTDNVKDKVIIAEGRPNRYHILYPLKEGVLEAVAGSGSKENVDIDYE